MTLDAAERQRLRELCEKATPGPWTRRETTGYSCGKINGSVGWNIWGSECVVFHLPVYGRDREGGSADSDLIAAARNALPAALDMIDALERAATAMIAAARTDDGLVWSAALLGLEQAVKGGDDDATPNRT